MKSRSLRFLCIGASDIAKSHIDALRDAGHECVGIVSRSSSSAELAKKLNIGFSGISVTDAAKILKPDGVLILTQPSSFSEIAAALKPFQIPVLIEKPLGYTAAEARKWVSLLPPKTMVALNRRHYSVAVKVKEMIGAEAVQAVVCIPERLKDFINREALSRDHWPMMNSIHPLDLFFWLLGHPEKINFSESFGHLSPMLPGVSQQYFSSYQSRLGHHCRVISNFSSPGGWRILIFDRDREIGLDPLESGYVRTLSGRELLEISEEDKRLKPGFLRQIQTFARGIQEERLPEDWVSVSSALESMEWMEKLIPFNT